MVNALLPLTLEAAVSSRRGKRLVGPVDLKIESTGTTVLIGPNGSGKTTLLRLMHGAARLSSGQINWACDIEQARYSQAFVFQRPVMLRRSVEDNLMYPLTLRKTSRAAARRSAQEWAERVGISSYLSRRASVLSGGEQQKLAIARALVTDPSVVFLDEPTAALDGRATRDVEAILQEAKASGTKLILSTHDMGQARRIADDIVFMLGGEIRETGAAKPFFAMPETVEAAAFLRGDIVE